MYKNANERAYLTGNKCHLVVIDTSHGESSSSSSDIDSNNPVADKMPFLPTEAQEFRQRLMISHS